MISIKQNACAHRTRPIKIVLLSGFLIANITIAQANSNSIIFGAQRWPGLKVKTAVVSEILKTIGYSTKTKMFPTSIVMHSLTTQDVDVALGAWYPGAKSQIDPLIKTGKVVKLATNVPDALSGFAVPNYVHKAGVDTVQDMIKHANKFNYKIYGIESGSSFNATVQKIIRNNKFNLGDWNLNSSSTAAMLVQVGRKIKKHEWIVFYEWKPHWMNKVYNLYYINSNKDSLILDQKSEVYTLVRKNFPREYPNVTQFLKQFTVKSKVQSTWIYKYSHANNGESADTVAHNWIASHLKVVKQWLQGVKTTQEKSAFPVVKSAFQ